MFKVDNIILLRRSVIPNINLKAILAINFSKPVVDDDADEHGDGNKSS